LGDSFWNLECVELLFRNLFRVAAHDQMNLVRRRIDLPEQALHINRPAGASGGENKFHFDIEGCLRERRSRHQILRKYEPRAKDRNPAISACAGETDPNLK
jgi:hypothetical protein